MSSLKNCDLNDKAIKILKDNQILNKHYNLSVGGKNFLNKAIKINQTKRPFTMLDFPEITHRYFKQLVYTCRIEGFVETVHVSGCAYYRVIGFKLDAFDEEIAQKATGVTHQQNYKERLLDFLHLQIGDVEKPSIHNIRLHVIINYFYDYLLHNNSDFTFHKKNKSFTYKPDFGWGKNIWVTLIVTSTDLVQIIFHNTQKPIARDEAGMYDFVAKLGNIHWLLQGFLETPKVSEWIIKRADYGIDSKKPVNIPFHCVFKDYVGAMCQIYSKKWGNNYNARLETIIIPNISVEDFINSTAEVKN